jgi:O-antigen ligase
MYLKVKNTLQYINLCCLLLLVASLPCYYEYRKLPIILFFATYLVELIVSMRWKNVKLNAVRFYFLALLLFFLWIFLYYPFESNRHLFRVLMDRRLSLLGFALVGFWGVSEKIKLKYVLNTFAITSTLLIAYIAFYLIGIDKLLQEGSSLAQLFTEERIKQVNTHMMFNFFMNLSLASIWYLLFSAWSKLNAALKAYYLSTAVAIGSVLIITEGRSGFLTCIVITMTIVTLSIWEKKRTWAWITAILTPAIAIAGLSMHRRIAHSDITQEPRFYLWKLSCTLIKEKPLLGHGVAATQEKLTELRRLTMPPQLEGLWDEYALVDAHNQYLQTTMELGLAGLALLLFIYLAPLRLVSGEKRGFMLLITVMVLMQSFFDSFLNGEQFGITFGLLMVVLLTQGNPHKHYARMSAEKIRYTSR